MISADDCGRLLLELMEFHSEDEWCAGWIDGLEERCYRGAFLEVGTMPMHATIYALMREMAERSGVWWTYNDDFLTPGHLDQPEHKAITLEEAHKRWGEP